MTEERAKEILNELRRIAESDIKDTQIEEGDTASFTLAFAAPWFIARLKLCSELAAYYPNSVRWNSMAKEIEEVWQEYERKPVEE